jgi:TP901 family phage tail tape measure protein
MAVSAEALDIILRIQGLRGFQSGMRQAAASTRDVGRAAAESSAQSTAALNKQLGLMGMVRKAAMGIGVALLGAGVEAYKLNTQFDKQLAMVQSEAGASAAEVAHMRAEILRLAGPLQQSPIEMAKGLYHIESLGFRGSKALDLLKDSAHMANISGADLEETTTALGGAMIVGVRGAGSLTNTMGTLIATAGAGNMRMQNLVDALGTGLLSAAKNANMTLLDTGAALATLTDTGMPASSAAAQLRTALHFLYSPTDRARKALKRLGVSQGDLVREIQGPRGLGGALQLLDERLDTFSGGDNAKRLNLFGHILPGGRGQVLLTLMKNLDQYDLKNKQIAHTISHTATGIRVAETTNAAKLQGAWAGLQATLISTADVYADDLTTALVAVVGLLASLVTWLGDNKTTVRDLGIALGVLIGIMGTYRAILVAVTAATWLWNAATFAMTILSLVKEIRSLADAWILLDMAMEANPAVAIATAIILLIAGLVLAYHKVEWFHNAVDNVWDFITHHWPLLFLPLIGPFALAGDFIKNHWTGIINWLVDKINVVLGLINTAIGAYNKLPLAPDIGKIGMLEHIGDDKKKPGGGGGLGPAGGGPRGRNPLAPVPIGPSMWEGRRHRGGTTTTKETDHKERIDNHVHVYLDGKEVTAKVNKNNADRKARK